VRPLSAIVFRENRASAALLERLGFRFAGLCPAGRGAFAARERLRYVLRVSGNVEPPAA
jgi:RimJ/RimL family protein N-acetyltransferase